jgi:hypothetical protein
VGIKLGGGEGVARSDVSEAYQGMPEGQLSWVVEFEPGNAFTIGKHGWGGSSYGAAPCQQSFPEYLAEH